MSVRRRVVLSALVGAALALPVAVYLITTSPAEGPRATSEPGRVNPLPQSDTRGPAPRLGAPVPPFAAMGFNGKTLRLADLRGQGVVMNFFASWCVPCREEARDLERTYQRNRHRGIVFLAVNAAEDTWDDARAFLKQFGISYPAIRDQDGVIAGSYQMFGLPTTYFIDKNGILRAKYVGPFLGPEGLKELERRIGMILP